MAEIRQVKIKVRGRQVSGGALPLDAQMAEPFANLYDGVLRFSGVTGGGYEPSSVSSVFEVGSTLYNSKITNRLNINDNFIISGDTGRISTYDGTTSLSGTFLSGTTDGFVLAQIADIVGNSDVTRVQGGTNINTGGTANTPIINLDDDIVLTSVNATSISGDTLYSGSTDVEDIIYNILNSGSDTTRVQPGTNIITGGTANFPIVSTVDSPSFNDINFSGTTTGGDAIFGEMSANTLYSGSTDLGDIISTIAGEHTVIQGGTNIITGGTQAVPVISLVNSPSVNILSASGHMITNGTNYSGGSITDDGIFLIDAANRVEVDSDLLPTEHLTYELGSASARWNTIYGQDLDLEGAITATGITNSSLTTGRVVYAGTGGVLTDEAGFEYDEGANTLKTGLIQIGNPGDTGTTMTVYGDIIIVGEAISGFTSELYIEDNLIELNYNPTASTISKSLGAGWSIQDGSGIGGTDVLFDIRGTATGVDNRSFTTNLFDIRIRETGTVSSPNGVRLIAENDIVDGGSY